MQIDLQDVSKRFNREWIFKAIQHSFKPTSISGVIGSNGSGKSTLIKLISGAEIPSKGEITYTKDGKAIEASEVFSHLTFAAPYMDLAEELSCEELIDFHLKFKPFQENISKANFLQLVYLEDSKNKFIKNFSSGMKQRLKLGLAICTQSHLLLLDEPCSNLDTKGIKMYHNLMDQYNKNRTTIIGSNEQKDELYKTDKLIRISDYK